MRTLITLALFLAFASCGSNEKVTPTSSDDCICTEQYDPVCGSDGKTYGNPCKAACAGVTSYTAGACRN